MGTKLTNNATGRLAVSLTAASTQLSMIVGDAVKFPTIAEGSGDNFPLTAVKANGELEIMLCTLTNGNVFTVQRGQEGTSPKAFSAGDRIELRLTAGTIDGMIDDRIDAAIEVVLEDLGTAAYKDVGDGVDDVSVNSSKNWLTAAQEQGYAADAGVNPVNFPPGTQGYNRTAQDGFEIGNLIQVFAGYNSKEHVVIGYPNRQVKSFVVGAKNADTGWTAGPFKIFHDGNKPKWGDIEEVPEDLVRSSRTISTSSGLKGGGDLSENRELSIENSQVPITATNLGDSNLNDIQNPGYYYQPATAKATSARNYPPSLVAGDLVVRTSAGVTQEYTDYQSRRKFYRGFYGNIWSAWREIYTDNSSIPSSKISGFGTAADFNVTEYNSDPTPNRLIKTGDFGLGLTIPYEELWETAFHKVTPENKPNRLPSGTYEYGALLGIQHEYNGYRAELYIAHDTSNDMYVRSGMNRNWSKIYHSGTPPSWWEVTGKPDEFKPHTWHGDVGTYAFVIRAENGSTYWGEVIAGSALRTSNSGGWVGGALTGTWRIMGSEVHTASSTRIPTLAVRIS